MNKFEVWGVSVGIVDNLWMTFRVDICVNQGIMRAHESVVGAGWIDGL